MESRNIRWHGGLVSDVERRTGRGTGAQVLWLTGLSGSGKSTVGAALERICVKRGFSAFVLDGDNVRHGLCSDLGFSDGDRAENIRRIAEAARLVALSGNVVIVCVISPSAESRAAARAIIGGDRRCRFDEVFVSTPVDECAKRDPKGLYKKAYAGEITNFTGVDAAYDVPLCPEVTIDTVGKDAEECAGDLFAYVAKCQMDLNEVLRTSVVAALEAGRKILEIYQRDFAIEYKDDKTPLTEADLASSEIITAILREDFPHVGILCEEEADYCDENGVRPRLLNRYCFIVDPIDGTKEFIKKNGEFTISIGFCADHKAVAGVIYVPVADVIYMASENGGAYKITSASKKLDAIRGCADISSLGEQIHVSDRSDNLIVVASRSHPDEQTDMMLKNEVNAKKIADTLSAGSCLKGCMIADGTADIHYRFGAFTKEWDIAAMDIICREAGGIFLSGDGKTMLYNRTNTINEKGFIILNKAENAMII